MLKKVFIALGIICLIYGTVFTVSPKVRSESKVLAARTTRVVASTAQRISQTTNTALRGRKLTVSTLTTNNCTYKEFSDLASPTDPNYGWAYWYMQSAKQNGILQYKDSDCATGSIAAQPSSQVVLNNVCQLTNLATGTSVTCPSGDGDSYSYWTRYLNIGDIKTELVKRGIATNNPSTPAGSNSPSWSDTGCVCQTQYCWTLGCETWTCDDCESNRAGGGTCMVNAPTYTAGCSTRAHLISLLDYNLNKPISYKIGGTVSVANNARPVTDLNGTRLDFYELNADRSRITPAAASATVTFDGTNQNYQMVFIRAINEFLTKVPGKLFEIYVTPGSDQFYPDARVFNINSVNTNINFSLLWKEDFSGVSFADVPTSHWAYWYVTAMAQNKIMGGFGGNFYPDSQVTRARTGLYSTLAIGAQPCCNIDVDPGTAGSCMTCAAVQYYYDLTPDNYFWGYAQSALLAGTMTGFPDQTFRPVESIIQDQVSLSVLKGGVAPVIPPGYTPGYSGSVPVARAQMAALYAWNFNIPINLKVTGELHRTDSSDLSPLNGANVSLWIVDPLTAYERKVSDGDAVYSSSTGQVTYELNWEPLMKELPNMSTTKFEVRADQTTFQPIRSDPFNFQSVAKAGLDLSLAVDHNSIHFTGRVMHDCPNTTFDSRLKGSVVVVRKQKEKPSDPTVEYGRVTVADDLSYSISIPKTPEGEYELVGLKDGYDPTPNKISSAEDNVDINVIMQPHHVVLNGYIRDAETKKGLANINVYLNYPSPDKRYVWTVTNQNGYYKLEFDNDPNLQIFVDYRIAVDEPEGYFERMDAVALSGCPVGNGDYSLYKKVVCDDHVAGTNVKMCWVGEKAVQAKDSPDYNYKWPEMAQKIESLRTASGQTGIRTFYFLSDTLAAGAYAKSTDNGRVVVAPLNEIRDQIYVWTIKAMIPHEFGHGLKLTDQQIIDEKKLFDQGKALIDKTGKDDTHSRMEVYRLLSPDDYLALDWMHPTGYAGLNYKELFAESFATRYGFDTALHQKIANPIYMEDIRNFTKNEHNYLAGVWNSADKIALDSIKNILAKLSGRLGAND